MSNSTVAEGVFTSLNDHVVTVTDLTVHGIMFVVGVLSLSLNALVLDTMVRRTSLEAPDLLMCHLAGTDMLTGVLVIESVLYHIVNFVHHVECLIRLGGLFLFLSSSVYHLALLTFDRFVKIVLPYKYPNIITRRSVSVLSCIIWIFSVSLGSMPACGWRNVPVPPGPPCAMVSVMSKSFLIFSLVIFYIPVSAIVLMYSKIFLIARRHNRTIAAGCTINVTSGNSFKFAKTVMLLIGSYVVTVVPIAMFVTFHVADAFPNMTTTEADSYAVYTSLFIYCNALINPIIYAFKLPPVRKRLLGALRHTGSPNDSQTVITRIEVQPKNIQSESLDSCPAAIAT